MARYASIASIIDAVDDREKTLTVLNRQEIDPIFSLLESMFDAGTVTVTESSGDPAGPANLVVLHDGDQAGIATSTLRSIEESLLLVNSDLYITGTRSLDEVDTPEVVVNLDDTTFSVSNKRKFLLIHLSRHIEAMAHETGGGILHTGFQELSRLTDERGTERAYRRLIEQDIDVHVYGRPDWDEPLDGMTVHAHETGEIPDSWFVVHDGDGDDDRTAALVATETGPNEYRGFWTFEPDIVEDVLAYLEEAYVEG